MSNCLVDWIGIRGCIPATEFSGVYVNGLPGINLSSIEGIADAEQVTYLGVWNDVQERALRKFNNRLITEFQRKYKLKSIRSTVDVGRFIDTTETTAPTNQYRGLSYELKYKNSYHRSQYQSVLISSVSVYFNAVHNGVILRIIDLDTNEIFYTKTFDAAVGWNTYNVNQVFKTDRLFIGFLDTGITTIELPLNESQSKYLFHVICGGNCSGALRGVVTTDFNDLDYGHNTFGVSATISAVCSYDQFICNNKQLLTTPLWYLLGAELMIERQFSSRLNRWTTTDKEKAQEIEAYFIDEFEKELLISLDGVQLNVNDGCVECNTIIEVMEAAL